MPDARRATARLSKVGALAAGLALCLSMAGGGVRAAVAGTFTVTTTADLLPASAGCPATPAKPCSLRAAIAAANSAGGTNTIDFAPGVTGTFPVTAASGGSLQVTGTQALTLSGRGAGATLLDGLGENHRVLELQASVTMVVTGVTVMGGALTGLLAEGGGIANDGTLLLQDSVVRNNQVGPSADGSESIGGGIFSSGRLTLLRDTVRDNAAVVDASGISGTQVIPGAEGGGVGVLQGRSPSLVIRDSTISGNTAEHRTTTHRALVAGGGVFVEESGSSSTLPFELTASTLSANRVLGAASAGGDIALGAGASLLPPGGAGATTLTLVNDTVDGNVVDAPGTQSALGGGLWLQEASPGTIPGADFQLTNLTITDNVAARGSALASYAGPGLIRVRGSVLSGDAAGNCAADKSASAVTSEGGNLDSGHSCGFGAAGDRSDQDPLLLPLASNGGPSMTRALKVGSPALDGVPLSLCPPPAADQRGVSRPQGTRCDIGAFEQVQAVTTAPAPAPTLPRAGWGPLAKP